MNDSLHVFTVLIELEKSILYEFNCHLMNYDLSKIVALYAVVETRNLQAATGLEF